MENNTFENQVQQEKSVQEAPAATEAVEKAKKFPVKLVAILGVAVVAIIAVILLIGALSNTYKAPIKNEVKLLNTKSYAQYEKLSIAQFNGLCESEMKAIYKLRQKSDDYDKSEEKEDFKDEIEDMKDEYGNNYKYSIKIEDKEKIDRDELKDLQEDLRDRGEAILDELKDLESEDIEDMADEAGISKAQCKKMIKKMKSIAKTLKKAKISAGYDLDITTILRGSELDERQESEDTCTVYKINGRWVSESVLYRLVYMSGMGF